MRWSKQSRRSVPITLRNRRSLGGARRCGEQSGPQPADTLAKVGPVDRVPVVDQEPGALAPIGGGLDEALCGPLRARVRGHARVDDLASLEGEHDEDIQDAEPAGEEDEEVAGPSFVEVIADEGGPPLAALAVQADRAVLGDSARRGVVPELGELRSDDLLAPRRVLAPHLPNQRPEICVDRRTTCRASGAPSPQQAPRGTVPADDGRRFHQQDGVEQASRATGQRAEKPSIESPETRAFDPATGHDELLAE